MTLICKPKGRGNWHVVTIKLTLPVDMFRAQVGQIIPLGDLLLRICEVQP
ncbi:MAG: hypothetical protein U5L73_11400 [Rhodoferax sp.]|nr:hypothetical protein [Rhodoferax sp.]MDZ7892348.1 hypothetical protein [Rhodoferax sp.]